MKNNRTLVASLTLIIGTGLMSVGLRGQSGTINRMAHIGGDLGGTRYAPLEQIDATNFGKLQVAWRFRTDNLGGRPDFNLQTTPLMINGVLYATAGASRDAVAIDARTGELLWMYRLAEGRRATASPRPASGRGVGYWTDGKGDERIFYVTIGYWSVSTPKTAPSRTSASTASLT
jgi:glucose dehydrogenase